MGNAKSEVFSFRLTLEQKAHIYNTCTERGITPQKYVLGLIEKDMLRKDEIPEHEKKFIQAELEHFSKQLVEYFSKGIDQKLEKIYSVIMPKEEKIKDAISSLIQYTKSIKIDVHSQTRENWIKQLSESEDLSRTAAEIKQYIDMTVAEKRAKIADRKPA